MTASGPLAETLYPDRVPEVASILGRAAADRVLADPGWPALVPAVGQARSTGWTPDQLVSAAYDLLRASHPDDEASRPDELTTALTWRVRLLTESTSSGIDDPSGPPPNLHSAPKPDPSVDEDWPAARTEPDSDPGEHPQSPLGVLLGQVGAPLPE